MAVERFPVELSERRPIKRVAMLAVHSNPLVHPGSGDAGGMTVYIRQAARALASKGVQVDIFTRRDNDESEAISEPDPGVRVIQLPAGPSGLGKDDLIEHLPEFTCRILESWSDVAYDVIHSHYWLSGRVASLLSRRWGVPFVHTFHTLARVKNEVVQPDDVPEPGVRLSGEARIIAEADGIVASTVEERSALIKLYAAHPERIHVVSPGVDHELFQPGDREQAKALLGLAGKKVLLFVGRLQPLKAADTAVLALKHLIDWGRVAADDIKLLIVGGSSGRASRDEPGRLQALVARLGLARSVQILPPHRQEDLPPLYGAADVCLVPSHSESFGLVALEAQASGVPVVGSAVGGLKTIVGHGQTGFLVQPGASEAFAERAWRVLSDGNLAASMGRLAVCASGEFSWEKAAAGLYEVYATTPLPGELRDAGQDAKKLSKARRNLTVRH